MWPNEGVIITMVLQRGVAGRGSGKKGNWRGEGKGEHTDWLRNEGLQREGERVQCVSVS